MTTTDIQIGIVGLGPRGLSVLERLCANAADCLPDGRDVVLHLVDPHLASGGLVWRTSQSSELLMNTVSSQVTMFVDDSVRCAGPVVPGPSLYEWARFNALVGPLDDLPAHLLAEARRLGPDSYPSRAFYGRYLTWVLDHLTHTLPPRVRIVRHASQATDLRDEPDGSQTLWLGHTVLTGLDAVVLAQGHTACRLSGSEAEHSSEAARHGMRYIPPANPADVDLSVLAAGQPTVLRGMGLNFFDYLALLTIGRGGRFHRRAGGKLVYRPSGREPRLIAGCRRGVPHHARGENQKGPFGRHEPLFLTEKVITELRAGASAGTPADFRTDLWPLVDREVRAVYYRTLIAEQQCECDADQFLEQYMALQREIRHRAGPAPFDDTTTVAEAELLTRFGVAPEDRWSWHRIACPHRSSTFTGQADFHGWLLDYLDRDVAEAKLGNVHGPLKTALDVLRDLRNEIRLVVDHGGLDGASYRDDLRGWYTPFNAFVSIGPPVRRIEEMIALIEAGMLEVVGPDLRVELVGGRFVASSPRVPGKEFRATVLIEARLPEPDITTSADPLLRNLVTRGEASRHRIPGRNGKVYRTGGLAVSTSPYRLLDAHRSPHQRRFAFGVPTETVHWVTAASIRPGVNSVILCDADAIARASYQAALATTPQGSLTARA